MSSQIKIFIEDIENARKIITFKITPSKNTENLALVEYL